MDIRKVTDELSVAPQIKVEELPAIAAACFRAIICNRPDGEEAGQPEFGAIEAAAKAAGLAVRYQPIRMASPDDAAEFATLYAELPKPVLAYCRSGTRCITLWTISEAGTRPTEDIVARARAAGYDMSAVAAQAAAAKGAG